MTPDEALTAVEAAFRSVARPPQFIHGTCQCDECDQHERTLVSHTPDSISLKELGKPGRDPICFANDRAFHYYLPALLRLALGPDAYLHQLLFHLNGLERIAILDAQQTRAVLAVLKVIAETRGQEVAADLVEEDLAKTMGKLEQRLQRGAPSSRVAICLPDLSRSGS